MIEIDDIEEPIQDEEERDGKVFWLIFGSVLLTVFFFIVIILLVGKDSEN